MELQNLVVLTKLSQNVMNSIFDINSCSLKNIYRSLQNVYCKELTFDEALSSILKGGDKFESYCDFLERTAKLLNIIQERIDVRPFLINAIFKILNKSLSEKFEDWLALYEKGFEGEMPRVEELFGFVSKFGTRIDRHLSRNRNVTLVNKIETLPLDENMGNSKGPRCRVCARNSHLADKCGKKSKIKK